MFNFQIGIYLTWQKLKKSPQAPGFRMEESLMQAFATNRFSTSHISDLDMVSPPCCF